MSIEPLECRHLLSVGHLTSFFRAEEASAPIVDYTTAEARTLDVDLAYAALGELNGDRLAYGFWTREERSPQSWHDFRTVAARLQVDRSDVELYAYVGSPSYAGQGSFCWDDHASGESCDDAGLYADYERWAREVALASIEFPIIRGILLDDFSVDAQRDDGIDKPFTPTYVESIRAAGRSIAAGFRVEAIAYLPAMSAYDAQRFAGSLDAVHFFYRHRDEQGIDADPDRIAAEIEMFQRAYSAWEVSPLATIYHPSHQPAKAGDVVTVEATIDLATIHSDLVIAHFDSIAPTPSSRGWVQRTITFGGNVIYDADLADDALEVQVVTIPEAQIESLRLGGQTTATLAMQLTILQGFARWSYAANIFVSQPEDVYLDWTWSDSRASNVVVTGSDLESPPERYVGLYGGSPSFLTVTPDYTQRVLDHARAAYEAGDVEGVTVWEVMMNHPQSANFQTYRSYFAAVSLDERLGLRAADSALENWGGGSEKWIQGQGSKWYYILPSGDLYEWAGSGLAGTHLASLDPLYYAEPHRLTSAAQPPRLANRRLPDRGAIAAHFDEQLGLRAADKVYENWGGLGEKWLQGRQREWYFITPDGSLYEWDRQPAATGRLVARLSPAYHANLELLVDAHAYAIDALYGLEATDPRWDNWGGRGEKWFAAGGQWYYLLPDGSLWQWHGRPTAGLAGTLVATVDSSYHHDASRLVHAQSRHLALQFGFRTSGNLWLNWGGKQEKWFLDRERRWYFITPNGSLYEWDRAHAATGNLVAILDATAYDDLSWL